MSEPENFIARWSRRKREAEDADATKSAAAVPAPAPASAESGEERRKGSEAAPGEPAAPEPSELTFDPTKLPPIETITAESDIRPFLAPGVPAELTRAALRRVWATDPKIRDFVGLSENAWDFNAPNAIPGFGPLEMTEELRAEVARMVGRSLGGQTDRPSSRAQQGQPTRLAEAAAQMPTKDLQAKGATSHEAAGKSSQEHGSGALSQRNEVDAAPQPNSENSDNRQLIVTRLHGRALPK